MLNVVAAMGWPWFGPIGNNSTSSPFIHSIHSKIASASAEFDITLDQVRINVVLTGCTDLLSRSIGWGILCVVCMYQQSSLYRGLSRSMAYKDV